MNKSPKITIKNTPNTEASAVLPLSQKFHIVVDSTRAFGLYSIITTDNSLIACTAIQIKQFNIAGVNKGSKTLRIVRNQPAPATIEASSNSREICICAEIIVREPKATYLVTIPMIRIHMLPYIGTGMKIYKNTRDKPTTTAGTACGKKEMVSNRRRAEAETGPRTTSQAIKVTNAIVIMAETIVINTVLPTILPKSGMFRILVYAVNELFTSAFQEGGT